LLQPEARSRRRSKSTSPTVVDPFDHFVEIVA
jgi:hypothetical protein